MGGGYQQFVWTDERIARLRGLWAEGDSASEIAAKFGGGLSRSAILGKVHRMGLDRRQKRSPRSAPIPRKPKPKRKPFDFGAASLPHQKRAPGVNQPPSPTPPALNLSDGLSDIVPVEADPPEHERVSLLDLSHGHCRWPLGDKFCDRQTCDRGAGVYCRSHADRAYAGTGSPKKKWADDDPRRAAFAARARQTFNVAAE